MKHRRYGAEPWIDKPTQFVREVVPRFGQRARVLDLGRGQGQDSVFLAECGFDVTAMDFVQYALDRFPANAAVSSVHRTLHSIVDFPYPFAAGTFDVTYSHLSLHYFTRRATKRVFKELRRVTRPGGLLCVMVNSVEDPEYGTGKRVGDDFFELGPDNFKRYFSRESLYRFTKDLFIPYLLEQTGTTHKDSHHAFVRLVAERAS